MKHRFTTKSRQERGHISRAVRRTVYRRDRCTCQYCREQFSPTELTIDHLVPLYRGGLDEITNYVTCCTDCNQKKANLPPAEFAASINIGLDELPVHGGPVIDNEDLPIQVRQLRQPRGLRGSLILRSSGVHHPRGTPVFRRIPCGSDFGATLTVSLSHSSDDMTLSNRTAGIGSPPET